MNGPVHRFFFPSHIRFFLECEEKKIYDWFLNFCWLEVRYLGVKKKRRFNKNGLLILKFRSKVLFTKNRYKLQHLSQANFRTSRCHSTPKRKLFFLTFCFDSTIAVCFCKLFLKLGKQTVSK